MKKPQQKVIELCIYIVLIIAVIVWTLTTGNKINPFITLPII